MSRTRGEGDELAADRDTFGDLDVEAASLLVGERGPDAGVSAHTIEQVPPLSKRRTKCRGRLSRKARPKAEGVLLGCLHERAAERPRGKSRHIHTPLAIRPTCTGMQSQDPAACVGQVRGRRTAALGPTLLFGRLQIGNGSRKPLRDGRRIGVEQHQDESEDIARESTPLTGHAIVETPRTTANVWHIDTGAGSEKGKLTIAQIDAYPMKMATLMCIR